MFSRASARILLVANAIPFVGVMFWDWSVFNVVFLYWLETVIIGVFNLLRMALCDPGDNPTAILTDMLRRRHPNAKAADLPRLPLTPGMFRAMKFFLLPFFTIHYGGFCYGHFVFITSFFGAGGLISSASGETLMGSDPFTSEMVFAAVTLAGSHLYSLVQNYYRGGEYRRTNLFALMMRPYGRIIVMHIAIIAGGALIMFLGSGVPLLAVLIILKTALDLRSHTSERDKFGVLFDAVPASGNVVEFPRQSSNG